MKFIILTFNCVLFSLLGYAQQSIDKILYVGQPLENYRNQICCAEKDSTDKNYYADSKCQGYRYLPAEKDSVSLGKVKFTSVFLDKDSARNIRGITYIKNYMGLDSLLLNDLIESDYQELNMYLNSFLSTNSKKKKFKKDKSKYQQGVVWKADNSTITLEKFKVKRRFVKNQIFNTIQIFVE